MLTLASFDPSLLSTKLQSKLDVLSLSGPGFVTRELFAYLEGNPDSNIVVLPKEYFYPASNQRRGELKP
jgi:hypothetical protein